MSTVDYELVRQLFHELYELSPAERDRLLDERNVSGEVRNELASLLAEAEPPARRTGRIR